MVVALIALFVALGGGAYAAATLPRNSVGTQQLKDGSVTARKLHNGAFTAEKIAYGTLLAKDFKAGQLPVGATGPTGNAGPQGLQGTAGSKGATGATGSGGASSHLTVSLVDESLKVGAGEEGEKTAPCPSGDSVTGGGYSRESGAVEVLKSEAAGNHEEWLVKVKNNLAGETSVTVQAVCGHVG